jgi:hypothetical protein
LDAEERVLMCPFNISTSIWSAWELGSPIARTPVFIVVYSNTPNTVRALLEYSIQYNYLLYSG